MAAAVLTMWGKTSDSKWQAKRSIGVSKALRLAFQSSSSFFCARDHFLEYLTCQKKGVDSIKGALNTLLDIVEKGTFVHALVEKGG